MEIVLDWLPQIDIERIRLVDILSAAKNFIAADNKLTAHVM